MEELLVLPEPQLYLRGITFKKEGGDAKRGRNRKSERR